MNGAAGRPAAFVDAALLLEQVGLGEDHQVPGRQVEPARQLPGGDEHGRAREVVGFAHRPRADLVVGKNLDRALGSSGRGGDEHDGVAARAGLS